MPNNAAYDLSVYEPAVRRPEGAPNTNPNNARKRAPQPAPAKKQPIARFILTAGAAAILMCAFLHGNVQKSELFMQQSAIVAEIAELNEDNARLQAQLDTKTSLRNVEEYAENVLGLQKIDSAQMEYFELESTNVITVIEKENKGLFVAVKHWFRNALEYMGF